MDCHCKDHLPGEWHSHDECDCHKQDFPTYSFVVTKVMEEDPGVGTVYISKAFMQTLQLEEGEPVELIGPQSLIVQAKSHPNPWIDTRMISLDKDTMEEGGFQLFSQVRIHKAPCKESESLVLEVPEGVNLTRIQIKALLEKVQGAVLNRRESIKLTTNRGLEIQLRIVSCEPADMAIIGRSTQIELLDQSGEKYSSRRDVTYSDVGGLDEAVRKVREVIQLPLKHPEIFFQLGIDPPRGVLLYGPSGTGKTLIAKAVAGETGCYFKGISGTEIMDKYYGESEAKLRAAFEDAYKNAPAIIFIDEIDALAPRRDASEGDVEKRVTAQLLALMDGMEERGQVIVLAATNLPNVLDTAVRRPGRFDREILIGVPDKKGRREILEIHTRDMPLENVDLGELAERTHGFVGADIKALCQEAGFKALRRILPGLEDTDQKLSEDFIEAIKVEGQDFEEAFSEMRPSSSRSFEVDLRAAGWDRIAGYATEIDFLRQIVLWPMQNAGLLSGVGVGGGPGLLITGPSGVGKTLVSRSLAKESGFNVIEIRGPELISKYMGESEKNIREIFRQARQMAPTVLVLDGIDSLSGSGWSDSKLIDRIVNQLVMEMNSIDDKKPVLVVAVANSVNDLPPALRATGIFGNELRLKLPSKEDRAELFKMYLVKDKVSFTGDYENLAANSEGLTGRDIAETCRRVILQRAKRDLECNCVPITNLEISEEEVLKALDRRRFSSPGLSV
jgi:transitional endoplasmic reticulum ATPase